MIKSMATSVEGGSFQVGLEALPDICPICHVHIRPNLLLVRRKQEPAPEDLSVIFECTRGECQRLFISDYRPNLRASGGYTFIRSALVTAKRQRFSEEISVVSEMFVEVYNQAVAAEAAELDQLTGIGLRKALEFLVKDYAIARNSQAKGEIEGLWLGKCIDRFIDDPNVKACATRAAWLGNDETHYIRKWLDKDINDLKVLIRLTVNWIENILLTEKYKKEMNGSNEWTLPCENYSY